MGPSTLKSSNARNDKFFPTRGPTPSEKSSTSSRSKRNTCFVCTNSSAYDSTKLINCSACKRRFHRGCHKPPVAQNSPSDWTCYMCAPPKDMPPAVKKRKLGRSVFAPAAGDRSRMSLDGNEIPESPQEQPNTANETASKPNAFAQPPRFAPFITNAGKQRSIDPFRSTRQIQPPRFAPSALEAKDRYTVKSTDSNLKAESKVVNHSSRIPDASVINSGEASRISTPTPARSNNQTKKPSYHEVIGMALHEAPDCCLSREGIQRWVLDNVPSYDSKDASWERGVWVTLSHSDDFVYLKEKAKSEMWTFSDGSSNRYRKWQKPVNITSSGSSPQDSTQSDLITYKENPQARSNTKSALPSTIDETVETIDLTMGDDEPLPPPSNPQEQERLVTEIPSISLLQSPGNISVTNPKDRQLLKRSNFVAFGKLVWGSTISVPPDPKLSRPFTDTGMQNNVLPHPDQGPPDIVQRSTTADDVFAEPDVELANGVVQMDIDIVEDLYDPEVIEPELVVPGPEPLVSAQSESDEIIQSGARQEPVLAEHFSHEHLAAEPPAQELLVEEPPRTTYADSAAQTNLPVIRAFALGNITQISLEPRVPAVVAPATASATANSATQTEGLPEPQTAPPNLSPAPTVQLLTPQAEPIESQPLQENGYDAEVDFEKDCLALLDEMMYPTKPSTPAWPSYFTSLPDPFTTLSVPLSIIQARPTRKQIFGKTELSRIEHNNALDKLNKIKLGAQNVGQIALGKGYTEEERKSEIEENEKEGHYDTLEELFNMPQQVVPCIYEQQLAFRDYAPNALGRIGRPRVTYKIGANAK